jgi:hypothetical protein
MRNVFLGSQQHLPTARVLWPKARALWPMPNELAVLGPNDHRVDDDDVPVPKTLAAQSRPGRRSRGRKGGVFHVESFERVATSSAPWAKAFVGYLVIRHCWGLFYRTIIWCW